MVAGWAPVFAGCSRIRQKAGVVPTAKLKNQNTETGKKEQRRQLLMVVLRLEYISDGDEAGYPWLH